MKIDTKVIIIIVLASIVIIGGFFGSMFHVNTVSKYQKKYDSLQDSSIAKDAEIKILKVDQVQLQNQISVREKEIVNLKKNIKLLKIRIDEKVDSVAHLDDKHTFDYITKYLSKRDSTKWR